MLGQMQTSSMDYAINLRGLGLVNNFVTRAHAFAASAWIIYDGIVYSFAKRDNNNCHAGDQDFWLFLSATLSNESPTVPCEL